MKHYLIQAYGLLNHLDASLPDDVGRELMTILVSDRIHGKDTTLKQLLVDYGLDEFQVTAIDMLTRGDVQRLISQINLIPKDRTFNGYEVTNLGVKIYVKD